MEQIHSTFQKQDGNYVLRYDIALKNDAAVSLSDTKYDCNLYIDKDVDEDTRPDRRNW